MEWSDLQLLYSIERAGTLSAAARQLGVDQSTVTRRLAAIHEQLGERVLVRRGGQYVLTPFGETLLPHLGAMEQHALAVDRAAFGSADAPRGNVRLTTVETLATYFIAPRMQEFARACPGIELEVDVNRASADLSRREADLALRLARPRQAGIVVKRVGFLKIRLYASAAYLKRHPDEPHLVVAPDESSMGTPEGALLRRLQTERITLRSPSWLTQAAAVAADQGVGALPDILANLYPRLKPLPGAWDTAQREVWLIVHKDLSRVSRIRAVMDFLTESAAVSELGER